MMTECVYTHQTTNSYDSYILGSGSCAVVLERGEDSYTAAEHRRSHGGWDFLWNLQQDTVRQLRPNARVMSELALMTKWEGTRA